LLGHRDARRRWLRRGMRHKVASWNAGLYWTCVWLGAAERGVRTQKNPFFRITAPVGGLIQRRTGSMRSTINLPLIAIAGAIFSQLANAEESNLEGRGKELLDARCAHCHAIARTGESPHSAAPPFRTLSRKYPIDELAESLAEGLSVGHPDMPEFVFEPDDITAILAYLNSIQEQ